ncbi:unnamed protein product [Chrysodeixis includens]|uniref:Uncharacterized protein n=1 Tax=Chrysodeixis includens TaxID=689277 RepID=A0A9N8KXV8_CHRIL|nr:unnamed protein product [Chrysodeixis includens]
MQLFFFQRLTDVISIFNNSPLQLVMMVNKLNTFTLRSCPWHAG